MSAVAGALVHYDLPDLVAALAPKRLLLINPVDAEEKELSQNQVSTAYQQALGTRSSSEPLIQVQVPTPNYAATIAEWLR